MAKAAVRQVIGAVKDSGSALTDRELLRRFVAENDHSAFAALVRRHTGLVLGVCRRMLPGTPDAEDATQAVFVVLVRKAGGRWQASIANWLYLTARKVSRDARRTAERRAKRERKAAVPEAVSPTDRLTGTELLAALDDELDRLPAVYREPLVLCYLEGLSREEAAARLGVPAGTVKIRLERGRKKLADAMATRGVTAGLGLLTLAVTSSAGASPPRLIESILAAAGGSPSSAVAALAQGVVMNGVLTRAKLALVALIGVAVMGFGVAAMPTAAEPQTPAEKKDTPKADEKAEPPKADAPKETLSEEKLTIRVVDPDGRAVQGAVVYRHRHSYSGASPIAESVAGKTDADGKLVTEWKPFINFHATAEGYCASPSGYLESVRAVTIQLAKPLPIKGRLVDLQGKPVPNAKVVVERVSATANDDLTAAYNAYRVNPEWIEEANQLDGKVTGAPKGTTTDADGRFELKDVGRMRLVHLRFEAEGIEAARAVVFADPEFGNRMKPPTDAEKKMSGDYRATTHGPEFTHAARPNHVITGTVTDVITGKPVAGVKVAGTTGNVIRQLIGNPWQGKIETTTDADGKFRLVGLVKAKTRYLHVQGTDTAPYLDRIVQVDDVAAYTPVTADVKLTPAVVVRGQLVNKATGKSVAGSVQWLPLTANERMQKPGSGEAALYTIQFGHTSPSGIRAVADADGRFALRVPSGPGVVLARGDQFDPSCVFAPTRVRDEDRKLLRKPITDPNVIRVGPKRPDGEEFFDTIFFVTPLRWENGYAVVNPDAQTKTVDVKVELDPGTTVTLNATDPDGKPLSGVTVVGPGRYSRNTPMFAKPEIALGGLDPKGQPVQLYLLHKERKLCAAVVVTGDEKVPVAVKLTPCGSVTGRVVDHTGKAVKGARVMFQMTDSVADELLRQKLYRGAAEVATDADGKFSFPRLFPDVEFGLIVSQPGFRSGTAVAEKVTLKPGETKDVGEIKMRDPKKLDDE